MSAVAHRKGWCPGALRPMASGDGLILRLRIIGGVLTPALARALAQCAQDYGNGLIDLSARGNLQLRGVTEENSPELHARLDALGLLDADPAAEAVRNILASPLAGIDPSALLDIRPQVHALDQRLKSDRALHRLSGKFLFLIDDGGHLPLAPEVADVAFMATAGKQSLFFSIRLGGMLAGSCATDEVCETAAQLAQAFLELNSGDEPRMADLVRRTGAETVTRAAGLADMPQGAADRPRHSPRMLGFHALGSQAALGLGIAFGRIDAKALHLIADEAEAADGELRLSPWRAIFIVGTRISQGLADRMHSAGFILDEDAPLRAVAACSGKPGCLHGATASQADAARLAPLAHRLAAHGIMLHVSACTKGCAHPYPAPVTLTGRDGAYDLILDGRAGDTPLLRGLAVPDIEMLLQKLAAVAPGDRAGLAGQLLMETSR